MTPDLPPLPEPENAAETDGCTYACPEGFTADQLRAYAAEAVRLARLQALEDAARVCEYADGYSAQREHAAKCAAAIRQLKDRT